MKKNYFKNQNLTDLKKFIVENGFVLYNIHDSFFKEITDLVKKFILKNYKSEFEQIETEENEFFLAKNSDKKLINLSQTFVFAVLKTDDFIFVNVFPENILENLAQKKFWKQFIANQIYENLILFIINEIDNFYKINDLPEFNANNIFLQKMEFQEKQWFYAFKEKEEIILAFMDIKPINFGEQENLNWKYVLTSEDSFLAGFNDNKLIVKTIDLLGKTIEIDHRLKTKIYVEKIHWTVSAKNLHLFEKITPLVNKSPKVKIHEFAAILSQLKKIDYQYINYLLEKSNLPIEKLSKFYLKIKQNSQDLNFEEEAKELKELFELQNIEEQLMYWFNLWQPDKKQAVILLTIFKKILNETEICKIKYFYGEVYDKFFKESKEDLEKIIFEIFYAEFLYKCGLLDDSKKILERNLSKIKKYDIQELLPAENVSPEGKFSGQALKVKILELLSKIDKKQDQIFYTEKLAQLQPLVKERIEELANSNSSKKEKAKEILKILEPQGLQKSAETAEDEIKFAILDDKTAQKIKHPLLRKGNIFYNLSKWLSSVDKEDYSTLKKYLDHVKPSEFPQLIKVISEIAKSMEINQLDVFILAGEKSVGIRAYNDEKTFLTIGKKHLVTNSKFYLNFKELTFSIASELSFIKFGFDKITSSDVWRGAMEKGNFLLETMTNIIPLIKPITKAIKSVNKINKFSKYLENISTLAKKNEVFLSVLNFTLDLFIEKNKNADKKITKSEQLLAISRIMQITADRTGLVYSGDLTSSVRAILLTSELWSEKIDEINQKGLASILEEKDQDGNYKNLNLAIRIASLFSFYLSDEFQEIRSKILA